MGAGSRCGMEPTMSHHHICMCKGLGTTTDTAKVRTGYDFVVTHACDGGFPRSLVVPKLRRWRQLPTVRHGRGEETTSYRGEKTCKYTERVTRPARVRIRRQRRVHRGREPPTKTRCPAGGRQWWASRRIFPVSIRLQGSRSCRTTILGTHDSEFVI